MSILEDIRMPWHWGSAGTLNCWAAWICTSHARYPQYHPSRDPSITSLLSFHSSQNIFIMLIGFEHAGFVQWQQGGFSRLYVLAFPPLLKHPCCSTTQQGCQPDFRFCSSENWLEPLSHLRFLSNVAHRTLSALYVKPQNESVFSWGCGSVWFAA
jgi:hypothetical protein